MINTRLVFNGGEIKVYVMAKLIHVLRNLRAICLQHESAMFFDRVSACENNRELTEMRLLAR